jgi:hypothetical protein
MLVSGHFANKKKFESETLRLKGLEELQKETEKKLREEYKKRKQEELEAEKKQVRSTNVQEENKEAFKIENNDI